LFLSHRQSEPEFSIPVISLPPQEKKLHSSDLDAIQSFQHDVDDYEHPESGQAFKIATIRITTMKKTFLATLATAALAFTSLSVYAQKDPMVGGAEMYPTKTIVENAVNSPIHKTLVAAVKAGGLVDTLNSTGPFTVFAPTDDAFAKLPGGTVDTLVKPENKDTLDKILTYHVVAGSFSSKQLESMIRKGGGKATLKTVQGEDLTVTMSGGKIMLTDAKGGMATITTADVFQSNGVIHVIDTVLMPN
jgi:uncharacterized surface protein with fasciclin (FAS1) repeats